MWIFIFYPSEMRWVVKLFWGQLASWDIIIFRILRNIWNLLYIQKSFTSVIHILATFNFLKCLSVIFESIRLNFISISVEMSRWTFIGYSMELGNKDFRIWRKKKGNLDFLKILKIIISRPSNWPQKSLTTQRLSYG